MNSRAGNTTFLCFFVLVLSLSFAKKLASENNF